MSFCSAPFQIAAGLLWLVCLPGQTAAPEPATLMRDCVRAEAENNRAAANWLGREDIRRYVIHGKKRKLTGWQTYEASFLEGRPYYRRIAMNGKPLSRAQSTKEDALMEAEMQYRKNAPVSDQTHTDPRIGFALRTILNSRDFRMLREEDLHARRAWVVEGILRPDAPDPMTKADGGLSSDVLIWVDEESHLPIREELTVRKEWSRLQPGSKIILDFHFRSGLRLISKIILRSSPAESGVLHETEQTYSNYRKFGAESHIVVDPAP